MKEFSSSTSYRSLWKKSFFPSKEKLTTKNLQENTSDSDLPNILSPFTSRVWEFANLLVVNNRWGFNVPQKAAATPNFSPKKTIPGRKKRHSYFVGRREWRKEPWYGCIYKSFPHSVLLLQLVQVVIRLSTFLSYNSYLYYSLTWSNCSKNP